MQGKKTVLVIEDVQPIREALCSVLESSGFEVLGCDDGTTALAAAAERHFHFIITDYRMPNMNGADAARRLRELFPLSVIVGMSSDDKRADFFDAGADAFLLKPYDYNDLMKIMKP